MSTGPLWHRLVGPARCDLREIAAAFAADTDSAGAVIQVSDGTSLRVAGAWPGDPAAERALVVRVGQGVTGLVARNGHAMALGADTPRSALHRRLLGIADGGAVARLCLPARGIGGRIMGVVGVHRSTDRQYSDDDLTRLQPCADLLGLRLQVGDLISAVDEHGSERDRLIEQAVSAQESERRRIASDLHDGVTTALASMRFHLNAADLSLPAADPALAGARSQIAAARSLADLAYTQTRAAITGLHSMVLDDLGLVAALESLIETGPEGVLSLRAEPPERFADLPDHTAATLFRIAQEATSNAIRHARASHVVVDLRRTEQGVVLQIGDDGVGFDVRGQASLGPRGDGGGYGLSSIAERCALIGGSLRIDSAPGRGTSVVVELPVAVGRAGSPSDPSGPA